MAGGPCRRVEIEVLLERNPSLRSELTSIGAAGHKQAGRKVIAGLELYHLKLAIIDRLHATTYTAEQVLGDWFPPGPAA
jgi:hypothetical protein